MLLRLAYLAMTQTFAALRLLPMTDREKDAEILALRHQLGLLQRQLDGKRIRLHAADRAFLAALLAPLPRAALRRLRLLVSPDTILRWHRDLLKNHHARASAKRRPGRPRTHASIRRLVLRLAAENPTWGYRRVHGELALLGVQVAPSTVWEILKTAGIAPTPQRTTVTWASFLSSQAQAILAMDFIETVTLTGQRQYVLATIQHADRMVRILGNTAHPTHAWVTQAIKNLVMDLEDAGQLAAVKYLIRDRDAKYPSLIDSILDQAGITTTVTGIRIPRMNSITERWVRTLRRELLDRTLIWNEHHLRHALNEYQQHYNKHRTHRTLQAAAPLRALPEPLDPEQVDRLDIRRHDRLNGVIHEHRHAC
ncbi:integrase core domain-containing protein [Streptomyces sp. NBC_01016]|uniref:integrase core domain-containing protein n=1 Tax=Streptomyces sp. NBC_01016 TaxID=2903720 RepID=UPI00225B52EA|nr:integrase core domain-containing protein [Streptomyces sp. NBC_01016]MCX4834447.1 integrase core domain-containing protein [Streptomyces sp. NBC_01016]